MIAQWVIKVTRVMKTLMNVPHYLLVKMKQLVLTLLDHLPVNVLLATEGTCVKMILTNV